MTEYLRGQIATMANVNMETLRYYEELGLISALIRKKPKTFLLNYSNALSIS